MTIKGGLLDCEGQMEIEENLNRLQERYGYEEVVTLPADDWGTTTDVADRDVGDTVIKIDDSTHYCLSLIFYMKKPQYIVLRLLL